MTKKPISYKNSGVNIEAADRAKKKIRSLARSTFTPQVLSELGKFGGFYALSRKYKDPVLISSTDSVGTKLKVAFMANKHDTIGQDIVNHCVNDILVHGAKPLFFLDYIGTSNLSPGMIEDVVKGLSRGCRKAGCALVGGEMAELPGFYNPGEYDLVGFVVGVVEKNRIIDGRKIKPKDQILGLRSSGLHTNGYSLARKVLFELAKFKTNDYVPQLKATVGKELLKIHRSYVKSVHEVLRNHRIKGMAHITGGGIAGNLIRILPENCKALIDLKTWRPHFIFDFIQRTGNIDPEEMFKVFNMGIGWIMVVSDKEVTKVERKLTRLKEKVYHIGEITSGKREVRLLNLN
jgi:phosphoribosylformylglycinamidine cyclo-ligase